MARLTRKELKQDPFLSVYYDDFVEFATNHYQQIILVVLLIAAVIIAGLWWRRYQERQALNANALLGKALSTFNAPVGQTGQDASTPGVQTFADPAAKYQAAIKQFELVYKKYPHQKAGEIALYHIGICQAELGQQELAINTLQRAEQVSDAGVAALARFALAGELAKSGNLTGAQRLFRDVAEHPTTTVPAPTAWLALAEAERATQPAQARQIYEHVMRDYGSSAYLTDAVKQKMASLSQ